MVEPVTTAILAAIAAGAAAGATETAKKAIADAYAGLKTLLASKLGSGSEAVEAVNQLEKKPTSAGWKETATDELATAGVNEDQELVAAAETVLSKLKELPDGDRQHIMQAVGSYIAQADRGSTAKVDVNSKD